MYLQIFLSQIPHFGSWEETLDQYVSRNGERFIGDAKLARASFVSSNEPSRTYEPNFKKLMPEDRFYALKSSSLIVGTISYGFCLLAWLGMAVFKGVPIHDSTFVWTLALMAIGTSLLMSFFLFCSYKNRHMQLLLVKESKEYLAQLKSQARTQLNLRRMSNPVPSTSPAMLRAAMQSVSVPAPSTQKQTKKRKKKILEEEKEEVEQPKKLGRFDIL